MGFLNHINGERAAAHPIAALARSPGHLAAFRPVLGGSHRDF
jgi:hypothetical protein